MKIRSVPAVVAVAALAVGCTGSDPDPVPGPTRSSPPSAIRTPTPTPTPTPMATARVDTDGDGVTEQVVLTRGWLRRHPLGWFPPSLVWADADQRLLAGYAEPGTDRLATYHWPVVGTDAVPVPVAMHCLADGAETPLRCGRGSFVGSPDGLPTLLPRRTTRSIPLGGRTADAPLPGGGTVAVRLTGSRTAVTVEVGQARLALPSDADATTVLLRTALEHAGDLVLVVVQAAGDSARWVLLRYDGATIRRVPVAGAPGWRLAAGGPAAGGPAVDTWLSAEGRLFTARSELGAIFYEQVVAWAWEGDRLVSRRLPGPVCVDTFGGTEGYGDCAAE